MKTRRIILCLRGLRIFAVGVILAACFFRLRNNICLRCVLIEKIALNQKKSKRQNQRCSNAEQYFLTDCFFGEFFLKTNNNFRVNRPPYRSQVKIELCCIVHSRFL